VSNPAPPRFPRRLFWLLHAGGWAAYFLHGYMSGIAHGKEMGYWKLPLTSALTGFVMTLGLRYLLRAWWHLPPLRLVALATPAICLASVAMGAAFVVVLVEWCGEMCSPDSTLGYVAYLSSYLYVVLAWVGLYIGIKYYRQLRQQTEAALAATAMAHQAQLKMLRYQLNPHFLFNTLNAISTLVLDRDNDTANRMVQRLSAFLRHSLDNDPMQRVTLRQELDALALYLDIEKVRFADRLRLELDIAPDCERALLPSLLLQPLVENAIKYAIARQVEGGTLSLRARREGGALVLSVRDDGPGSPALADGGQDCRGVGLANTRERLRVLYGERQRFDVRNREPRGVEVSISIPFQALDNGAAASAASAAP
jgi:two-component sensor histidine kinase